MDSSEEQLKYWLEEYKALAADIQNRVTLQQALLNIQLIFLAALIALIVGVLKKEISNEFSYEVDLAFLLLPIIFSFFAWRHSNHDANIIDKAAYIYQVIRPNVRELIGGSYILEFESFLLERRKKRKKIFGIFVLVGGDHMFHIIFSVASLLIAFFIFSKDEFSILSLKNFLIILDVITVGGALYARLKIVKGYKSIVPE